MNCRKVESDINEAHHCMCVGWRAYGDSPICVHLLFFQCFKIRWRALDLLYIRGHNVPLTNPHQMYCVCVENAHTGYMLSFFSSKTTKKMTTKKKLTCLSLTSFVNRLLINCATHAHTTTVDIQQY